MTKRIPLSGKHGAGRFALIDDADAERVAGYSWYVIRTCSDNLYAAAYVPGAGRTGKTNVADGRRHIYMHTLLTGWPRVDHANGNGLDNTRRNIREYAGGQNNANSRSRGGISEYKGAYYDKRRGHWYSLISVGYRARRLGTFATEEAAARAYDVAALKAWGEFAQLNFPVTPKASP